MVFRDPSKPSFALCPWETHGLRLGANSEARPGVAQWGFMASGVAFTSLAPGQDVMPRGVTDGYE